MIIAATALMRSAPPDWKNFLEALDAYVERARDDVVTCSPSFVLSVQGRARGVSELLELLLNAPQNAAKIEKNR